MLAGIIAAFKLAGPMWGPAFAVFLAGCIVTLTMHDKEKSDKRIAALERELGYVRSSRSSVAALIGSYSQGRRKTGLPVTPEERRYGSGE